MLKKITSKDVEKRGPKIDPWGAPSKFPSYELHAEFILFLCLRFDK